MPFLRLFAFLLLTLSSTVGLRAEESTDAPQVGLDERVSWTTSRIIGSPEPPLPYITEQVFPSLTFNNPVDLEAAPGTNRLFVVEQSGKVYSFENDPDVEQADLVIDIAQAIEGVQQTYAIAFDPDFEQNGYCYVCCIHASGQEDGTRIVRFVIDDTDPPTINAESATNIITFLSGGHNGCCLEFGLDGYLYISTGDGSGPNPPDTLQTGQDVSDLLSSILRIDVSAGEAERAYRIPDDNPFVDTEAVRPEIWAYGFRNPWRMSIDQQTGDLWVGDVGWELWELMVRVERGGNYGWSVMEGRQPTNPEWPRGPTPILPPTIDHPHSESSSITDGVTYYGSQLPELVGAHIYGDYDTGKIWAAKWENGAVTWQRELADTTLRIVDFDTDQSGEMFLLHHIGGTIHQLIPNPDQSKPSAFPHRLSETGLFDSVADHTPAAGVIPYSINAEPWEDGAVAERFVAVPGEGIIGTADAGWTFPADSVLAKTLSLDVREGDEFVHRRMETQILHYSGTDWRAYTYHWNDAQTDAVLVDGAGEDVTVEVPDDVTPGEFHKQTWHFASRTECLRCHNPWSGSALAFQTAQLDGQHSYDGRVASQLDTLLHIGLCAPEIPEDKRTALVDPYEEAHELSARARSYLHVNCAHCHRMHAGSSVLSKMQYDLPLDQTTMVGERPSQGTFSIPGAQVIAPGDPFRSVLMYRISKIGPGHMPHIGAQQVDPRGITLIEDWINSLPDTTEDKSPTHDNLRERDRLAQLESPFTEKSDELATVVDELLSSTSGALMLLRAIDRDQLTEEAVAAAVSRGAAHEQPQVRDLFERFLPEDQRVQRLGSAVRPDDILSLEGDVARGRELFLITEGVHCRSCHRLENVGRSIGPDLAKLDQRNTPSQLLESILQPSRFIEPKYVAYLVETKSGELHTGLLVKKDGKEVVLRDAQDRTISVPVNEIEQLVGQRQSLMPELLVRDLTAQQVADLLAYLTSLK